MATIKVSAKHAVEVARFAEKLERRVARPIKRPATLTDAEMNRLASRLKQFNTDWAAVHRVYRKIEDLFDRNLSPADAKWADQQYTRIGKLLDSFEGR